MDGQIDFSLQSVAVIFSGGCFNFPSMCTSEKREVQESGPQLSPAVVHDAFKQQAMPICDRVSFLQGVVTSDARPFLSHKRSLTPFGFKMSDVPERMTHAVLLVAYFFA